MNRYEMIREKAKAMGHAAANAPDSVIQKVMEAQDRRSNLTQAKIYVENYMMGNLEPSEFAEAMAENDALRYAVSDLCRARLEPRELNVQRNDNYIDIGAGIKTFWTEIRVPLPSEAEAARDIRNINAGVEAGKRSARKDVGLSQDAPAADPLRPTVSDIKEDKPKSLRDRIADARQHRAEKSIEKAEKAIEKAEKTIEKNRPIAEGRELPVFDESWLDTEDGREYKAEKTRKAATELENTVMDIEAGMDQSLSPDERKKAMNAAGIDSDVSNRTPGMRSGYSRDELDRPLDDEMKELMDQIASHMGQDTKKDASRGKNQDASQDADKRQRKGYVYGQFEGKNVHFKGSWSGHEFTDEESSKLLAGDSITFDYTDRNGKSRAATGKLEWQENDGRKYLGFSREFGKKQETSRQEQSVQEQPASDSLFTEEDAAAMEQLAAGTDMNSLFGDEEEYQRQLAEDMKNYHADAEAVGWDFYDPDEPMLTEADCNIGDEGQGLAR